MMTGSKTYLVYFPYTVFVTWLLHQGAYGQEDERYIGCFIDDVFDRVMDTAAQETAINTPSQCIKICLGAGYNIAGVQSGNQCYCSYSSSPYYRHGVAPAEECKQLSCPGDNALWCGGTNRLAIYTAECASGTYNPPNCDRECHCLTECSPDDGACPSCEPGYMGPSCQQVCPWGRFGSGCLDRCNCLNNVTCNLITGQCPGLLCAPGWHNTGASDLNCQTECSIGTFGIGCDGQCHCSNIYYCDRVTGSCSGDCAVGWTSEANRDDCQKECPVGRYGYNCVQECNCLDNTLCDKVTGACPECAPGWSGNSCHQRCPFGNFGQGCSGLCHCEDNAYCDSVDGSCGPYLCVPGYISAPGQYDCQQVCPYGTYGLGCAYSCRCAGYNHAFCDIRDGHCTHGCADGWSGYSCQEICPDGYYGAGCASTCPSTCPPEDCNHVTGECIGRCSAGRSGDNCQQTCEENMFGPDCNSTCHCSTGGSCHSQTGSCHGVSPSCAAGWMGYPFCQISCPQDRFGENCDSSCNCENACDPFNGWCSGRHCAPGWTNYPDEGTCRKPCDTGFYGPRCSKVCLCRNILNCDKESGICSDGECLPGWEGPDCQTRIINCPFGYYSKPHCNKTCNCLDNSQCDEDNGGCPRCPPGWIGFTCNTICKAGTFGYNCVGKCELCDNGCDPESGACYQPSTTRPIPTDNPNPGQSRTIFGLNELIFYIIIGAAILLVLLIVFSAVVCRKRRRKGSEPKAPKRLEKARQDAAGRNNNNKNKKKADVSKANTENNLELITTPNDYQPEQRYQAAATANREVEDDTETVVSDRTYAYVDLDKLSILSGNIPKKPQKGRIMIDKMETNKKKLSTLPEISASQPRGGPHVNGGYLYPTSTKSLDATYNGEYSYVATKQLKNMTYSHPKLEVEPYMYAASPQGPYQNAQMGRTTGGQFSLLTKRSEVHILVINNLTRPWGQEMKDIHP